MDLLAVADAMDVLWLQSRIAAWLAFESLSLGLSAWPRALGYIHLYSFAARDFPYSLYIYTLSVHMGLFKLDACYLPNPRHDDSPAPLAACVVHQPLYAPKRRLLACFRSPQDALRDPIVCHNSPYNILQGQS